MSDGHPDLYFPNGGQDGPDARLIADAPMLAAENKRLKDELNRVAPFLAIHHVEGYTMEPVEDWDHPVGITFAEDTEK